MVRCLESAREALDAWRATARAELARIDARQEALRRTLQETGRLYAAWQRLRDELAAAIAEDGQEPRAEG